jgi:hypothetical protein
VILGGDFNDGIEPDGRLNGSFDRLVGLTGYRSSYGVRHALGTSSQYLTGNSYNKTARAGRMIDHLLVSNSAMVVNADVDRTMFTAAGAIVPCAFVTNQNCPNGMSANSLRLYSDHWAVWASLQKP